MTQIQMYQIFLGLAGLNVTLLIAAIGLGKLYIDAKFEGSYKAINARLLAIENQLKFFVEHT
jgi:hypothetical protein